MTETLAARVEELESILTRVRATLADLPTDRMIGLSLRLGKKGATTYAEAVEDYLIIETRCLAILCELDPEPVKS